MRQISAATLGGAMAPAAIRGAVGGATARGALRVAEVGGTIGTAALGGTLGGAGLSGSVALATGVSDYAGPYEATPTREAQTFPTAGRRMASDFTVGPIPSNWGLITWNGSTLTVS